MQGDCGMLPKTPSELLSRRMGTRRTTAAAEPRVRRVRLLASDPRQQTENGHHTHHQDPANGHEFLLWQFGTAPKPTILVRLPDPFKSTAVVERPKHRVRRQFRQAGPAASASRGRGKQLAIPQFVPRADRSIEGHATTGRISRRWKRPFPFRAPTLANQRGRTVPWISRLT